MLVVVAVGSHYGLLDQVEIVLPIQQEMVVLVAVEMVEVKDLLEEE
tara:strand:+ start:613 stop:750 length:138 start_codon:yes stop_codon:yes gene_type:complete